MAISAFLPREEYVGAGTLAAYTFDFKITSLEHLLILVTNASYVKTFKVRGSDTTYLSSVTFDAVAGGGTVTLASNLPSGHFLTILLANDAPLQESEFKDKGNFTLSRIESALDALTGPIQHLAYLAARSLRLSDSLVESEASTFDPTLPFYTTDIGVIDNSDRVLAIGNDNASFKLGPTTASIAADSALAVASAAAAASSETNAANSATSASASATSATASATAASVSAVAAADAADIASAAVITTAASAAAAATSATNAATSATNASTSASTATTQAAAALTSANNAATSETNAATSATNAATSATNAAASATSAAASATSAAASAAAAVLTVVDTRAAPTAVVAANGVLFTSTTNNTINFIQGSGGAVIISAAARIQAGTTVGQRLTLIGRSDTNTVSMADGNGIYTGGLTIIMGANSITVWLWDSVNWVLESANGLM